MMKKLLLLAFAVVAFAACSKDDDALLPVEATGIELNEKTARLNPGGTLQLTAVLAPAGAEGVVIWKSDDQRIATVSDKGLITAVAAGEVAITASCGRISASCEVTVTLVEATGIELNEKTARLDLGGTLQLVAAVTPVDAGGGVTWKSDDERVATVSDKGLVTAVAAGGVAITASCGRFSASCEVTVVNPFEVISFEASEKMMGVDGKEVALGEITVVSGKNSKSFPNLYWAKEYTEANDLKDEYEQLFFAAPLFSSADGATWFSSYYCDCTIYGAQYDAWGGFMLSSNVNKSVSSTQAGLDNQFEAYADGGAEGSKNFAVCYDAKTAGMVMSADCCWPQIDFAESPREPLAISLANSTWTYNYFDGNAGNSYAIRITGSKKGVKTGEVLCPLIDGTVKVDGWQKFDLSSLGEVDCLVFAAVSSEPYAPLYFCVDNIVLKNK